MHHPQEQIATLYAAHAPAIVQYLTRLTGSVETAEDFAQDTFVKALRAWDKLDDVVSIRAWLFRIATNVAYDEHRRQRRRPTTPLTIQHTDTMIGVPQGLTDEERVLLWVVLDDLSDYYRRPLLLSYAGYQVHDIAAMLGWKLGTVKSRLARARAQLRTHYMA